MKIEVLVPALPESVSDATLINWHKKSGDSVRRDENLVDLETDKVVLEIPAPEDGVLTTVLKGDGETVSAGDVLAVIEELPAEVVDAAARQTEPQKQPGSAKSGASPAVRRLLLEHNLDATRISGTGKGGRLTKADVLQHLKQQEGKANAGEDRGAPTQATPISVPAPASNQDSASELTGDSDGRTERRVPMTHLRARIAERLVQAQQTAAILTTFNEVNLQAVMELRQRHKGQFQKDHNVKLGFMSFFVKASVQALKAFPVINASVDGKDIVYHGYFDIGIAVSSPRGLVVPILRNADQMSFADIEKGIQEYGRKARDGGLSFEDLTGGTFTISNGGVFGSMLSTPILNPPQSAILGMHTIQQRPMAENGEVVIRPMMYLALSYDHRIVDGRDAVQFLVTIREALEDPGKLLLDL